MRGGFWPAFLAFVAALFTLFSLAGYQVTSETAATRLLGRLAAAVIELDRWLPAHEDDLDLLARDKPQDSVKLPDVPLSIALPASAVIDASRPEIEAEIRRQAGRALYERGPSALREVDGEPAQLGFGDRLRWAIILLDEEAHAFWKGTLLLALLLLLAFTAAVVISGRNPFLPLTAAAWLGAAVSIAVWLLAQGGSSNLPNPVDREIILILRDGAWIGLRNSLAVGGAGLALTLLLRGLGASSAPRRLSRAAAVSPPDLPASMS